MDAQRKRRCSQTTMLIIGAAVLLLIIATLFTAMVVIRIKQLSKSGASGHNKYKAAKRNGNMCLTPGCTIAAVTFMESMDPNVDPCSDFYEYACGRYAANASIPESRVSRRRIDLIEDSLNNDIRLLLEKPKISSEMSVVHKAKDFYATCMNSTRIDELGLKPLVDLLRELSDWPVIVDPSGMKTSNYIMSRNLSKFDTLGLDVNQILTFKVSIDKSRKPDFLIMISEPELAIPYVDAPEEEALKHPDIVRYQKLLTTVAERLGAMSGMVMGKNVIMQIEDIVRFEYRLSQIVSESIKNKPNEILVITVEKLAEQVPQFQWIVLFRELIFKTLRGSDPVVGINMEIKYVKQIVNELRKITPRILKSYVYWRAIYSTLHLLSIEYQLALHYYESMTAGHEIVMPDRWEICVKAANKQFVHALGHMYVKHFRENNLRDQQQTAEFFRDLTRQMNKLISDADWLDYKTRTTAIGKIQEMKIQIGYPKEILVEDFLQMLYKDIKIIPNEYFKSTLRMERVFSEYNITRLRMINQLRWYDDIATKTSGSYSLLKNQIEIPGGMMHKLYLAADRPNYINYAMMGYQIAHLIAHGFDSTGPLYDKDGIRVNWWDPSATTKFEERASCFVDQYSTYIAPESNIQVDGVKTLAANIADNVAVKIAYAAYKARVKENDNQKRHLPHLTYSAEKLFWISYANNWCTKLSPSASKQNMESDRHSPSRFRVNGVVSNSPDFARDFKCKNRTQMNPMKKCKIW